MLKVTLITSPFIDEFLKTRFSRAGYANIFDNVLSVETNDIHIILTVLREDKKHIPPHPDEVSTEAARLTYQPKFISYGWKQVVLNLERRFFLDTFKVERME
jgi:hypothetical protein